MQTPEHFRSLASTLLALRKPAVDEPSLELIEEIASGAPGGPSEHDADTAVYHDISAADAASDDELELMRDVRLFHARIIEAVEAAVETLAADIAADVLARELLLGPADIEAIVDSALQRFSAEEPLRVRVHTDDVSRVKCGVPVVADERLRPGDAVVELRNGSVDASLGVRLARALAGAAT